MAELSIDENLTAFLRGDPQLLRDPYPFYRRLREEAPVRRVGSVVFVSTHAEARAAYLDNRRLVNESNQTSGPDEALSILSDAEKRTYYELLDFERGYMSRMDGEDHNRVRSAAQPAFSTRRIAELEELTQQLTDELLQELARRESPDLMELAYRLPLLAITGMLGVPTTDADLLTRWGDAITGRRRRMPVQPELIRRAQWGLTEYRQCVDELVERTGRRSTTHLGAALSAAEERDELTREELVATYALILLAGHETTANLIGNGMLALLAQPDQWRILCDDPSLAPSAVEEAFRYDSPVQLSLRTAAVDLELSGVEVPSATPVWLLIGSANRDPQAFSNPDDVDITRRPNGHLGLGHGVHFCLGAPFARLQGQVVFSTLARSFPGIELAVAAETLPRSAGISMRGVRSLPVKLSS